MKENPSAPEEMATEETPLEAELENGTSGREAEEEPSATIQAVSVDQLSAELDAQRQKAQEHLDHLQRLQAEFSNYRRRMAQEKSQAADRGKEEVLVSLLPILGNFRLALQHADQDASAVRQGVQMIWQQCEDFLRNQGVEPIATVGQSFDPAKHEALSTVPATDETPANTVVAEINAGYMLNGHLLRAAQVVVTRAEAPEAPDPNAPAAAASDAETPGHEPDQREAEAD
jgi:molecular chaperone GrpE